MTLPISNLLVAGLVCLICDMVQGRVEAVPPIPFEYQRQIDGVSSGQLQVFLPEAKLSYLSPEERDRMRDQIRQQWEQMSPEDRQRHREEWRNRWQRVPPEDRQRHREEFRQRWERLSPEQRQDMRDAIREHRERGGGHRPDAGRQQP